MHQVGATLYDERMTLFQRYSNLDLSASLSLSLSIYIYIYISDLKNEFYENSMSEMKIVKKAKACGTNSRNSSLY